MTTSPDTHPAQERLRAANITLRRAGDRLSLLREMAEEAREACEAAIVEHQAALDAWVAYLKAEGAAQTKGAP